MAPQNKIVPAEYQKLRLWNIKMRACSRLAERKGGQVLAAGDGPEILLALPLGGLGRQYGRAHQLHAKTHRCSGAMLAQDLATPLPPPQVPVRGRPVPLESPARQGPPY
ncbi:hypothetical protein BH23BAC3_BH23BAC3_30360 [soil metagenome]